MKRCSRCQKRFPLEMFTRNRSERDGFGHYCRPCLKVVRRPALAKYTKSEKFRIQQRRYRRSEKGRTTARLIMQRLRKTEKYQLFERQYRRSDIRKVVVKRYQTSEKGRLTRKRLSQGEKAQNYKRLYRAVNQEKQEQYIREWLKTPQGKEYVARRHFHRRSAIERTPLRELLTSVQWHAIKQEHNYSCVYCGVRESTVVKLTRDHIVPVTKGGLHTKDNIVPACQPCNARKGTKAMYAPVRDSAYPVTTRSKVSGLPVPCNVDTRVIPRV